MVNGIFLSLLKLILESCDCVYDSENFTDCSKIAIANREKNMSFLYKNGLIISDICEILKNLAEKDHVKGPEPDHNYPDDMIHVYKSDYEGIEIYIKMKYVISGKKPIVKILSFHESMTEST